MSDAQCAASLAPELVIRDHSVEGLFVKEVAPAASGGLETPLLFVHGALHGWWAWEKWLGFFAVAGWRCYAMSLRNHTGSHTLPEQEYLRLKVADYADDISAVATWIRVNAGAPAALIGHSMGGIAAQKAAERTSPRALVLVASVGPGQLGRIRDPIPSDRLVTYSKEQARAAWFHEIDDQALAAFCARLVPESPGVVNDYSGGRVTIARERIACPILVIGAELDRTPVPPPRKIAAFYACPYIIVPNAAHDLMLESAALPVAIRLNQWLLTATGGPKLPPPTSA